MGTRNSIRFTASSIVLGIVLTLALISAACSAHAGDALDVEHRWSLGAEVSAGGALTLSPEDAAGEPSLLNGTSFSGWTWRFAGQAAFQMSRCLRFRLELGISQAGVSGFAAERDGFGRRELEFRMTRLDVPLLVEFRPELGLISPLVAVGYGVRVGLRAEAREVVEGFEPEGEGPLQLKRNVAGVLHLQTGLVFALNESLRLLTTFRAVWASTYPDTTDERLDGIRYRPDVDWEFTGGLALQVVLR